MDGRYPGGRPIAISISLPVGASFVDGILYWRQGGHTAYRSARLQLPVGAGDPSAFIPGEDVGPRGVEYYVQVNTARSTLLDPRGDAARSPHRIRAVVQNLPEAAVHQGTRYRMVTVPLDPGAGFEGTLHSLLVDEPEFGAFDPVRWRAFRYFPSQDANVELSASSSNFRPIPGRAFWLISRDEHRIDTAPVQGLSVPTAGPYPIVLNTGWNQFGNPFAFPVAWSSVSHGPAVGDSVAFDPAAGTAGDYMDGAPAVLAPFEAYFIHNASAQPETLWVQPVEAAEAPVQAAAAPQAVGWRLRLTARTAQALDSANLIGVDAAASDGPDVLDARKPPTAPGAWVQLALPHREWAQAAGLYRRDIRVMDTDGHRWGLEVRSQQAGEEVRLDLLGAAALPVGFQLRLLDLEQQSQVDLTTQPDAGGADEGGLTYRLVSLGPDRAYHLSVLVGARPNTSRAPRPERWRCRPAWCSTRTPQTPSIP